MLYLNQPVIDALNKLNGGGKATSIILIFSTLYTKIPYDKLLKALKKLIAFCFKGWDGGMASAGSQDAKWGKEKRSRVVAFTKNILKKDTKYFYIF